jgi:hypothetical protein
MPCKLQIAIPLSFSHQIYGIISFLFLATVEITVCPINPATLMWCCGFLGNVMVTITAPQTWRVEVLVLISLRLKVSLHTSVYL